MKPLEGKDLAAHLCPLIKSSWLRQNRINAPISTFLIVVGETTRDGKKENGEYGEFARSCDATAKQRYDDAHARYESCMLRLHKR